MGQKRAARQLSGRDDLSVAGSSEVTSRSYRPECRNENPLDKLEKTMDDLKAMFQSFVENFERENIDPDFVADSESQYEDEISEEEDDQGNMPPLLDLEIEDECVLEDKVFDFNPWTKEQEPLIPPDQPYTDAQKKLHASPLFNALLVSSQIFHLSSRHSIQEHMTKADTVVGISLYGILMQRDSFSEVIKVLITKYTAIKKDVHELLVDPDSKFRQLSDDILQYTCGRRAEIIGQRRKRHLSKNSQVAALMENIPPSSSHLFEAAHLAEVTKHYGHAFRNTNRRATNYGRSQANAAQNEKRSNKGNPYSYYNGMAKQYDNCISSADDKIQQLNMLPLNIKGNTYVTCSLSNGNPLNDRCYH
nr:unnamed protein product [Callosobruchus analis]